MENIITINNCEQNLNELSNINDENDINYTNTKNISPKNEDLFSDFSMNTSVVYETIENNDCEENKVISDNNENENDFCVNDCEQRVKRFSSKNEKLNKQIIQLEEQIVELIKDKQSLVSELNAIKESFDKKIILKNKDIEDLTNSLLIFESLNSNLEQKLEQKLEEKIKLELHIEEIEDKLFFSETQLSEAQKNEEELMMSYKNARQAFTEEENNKYKTIEQLHKVYVECAQQQNEIIELKEHVSTLEREIADRDNELWFYKSRTEESLFQSITESERHSNQGFKNSIYINKTASEIPEYSFSVNEDDLNHIYYDFNDEIISKHSDHSRILDESISSIENSVEIVEENKPFLFKLFNGLTDSLWYFIVKLPFKLILALILIVISIKVLLVSVFPTNLPAYTSWEEILYRIFLPYITKVKVSKTQ